MEMRTTAKLPTKSNSGLQQKSTREIIRSAFDSIQLPTEQKDRVRSTAGEEALFAL